MNSLERRKNRYIRRKNKRLEKINSRSDKYSNLNDIFVFHKVMKYADKCCNNVRWKRSTKLFILHEFTNIAMACNNIKNDCYKVSDTFKFVINERGKSRNISAPNIKDRLIHKVLANEVLVPIYSPLLIYDNGASQINKGFLFALSRVKKKINYYYRKNKNCYVVLIDFSKFFENCSHNVIHNIHEKYIKNDYTIKVIEDYLFIEKGISLGVELAQREAAIIPNSLDKFIINKGIFIERYMDDTLFICDNVDIAKNILNEYTILASKLDIKVNKKKTKIVKINKKINFCKWIYKLNFYKFKMYPNKKTIYRQRRKLRKLYSMYLKKRIGKNEINVVKTSFIAYLNNGNSYKYISYINKRYRTEKYKKKIKYSIEDMGTIISF